MLGWPKNMQVGPFIPARIQLQKAGGGPTSGPTWRLSHLDEGLLVLDAVEAEGSHNVGVRRGLHGQQARDAMRRQAMARRGMR